MYRLFIDDERFPTDHELDRYTIVRSSQEAYHQVVSRGIPIFISFDHDLGGNDTSMKFIHRMTDYILDMDLKFPANFDFYVHSQNPIGKTNIEESMKNLVRVIGYE
jgi:hypothetical protein